MSFLVGLVVGYAMAVLYDRRYEYYGLHEMLDLRGEAMSVHEKFWQILCAENLRGYYPFSTDQSAELKKRKRR